MPCKFLAGIVLVSLVALAGLGGRDTEADALEGTWLPEKIELGGKEFPEEVRKTVKLVIVEDRFTVTIGKQVDKGTIRHNEKANPKEMDITGIDGPNSGKTFLAIYEVNGDTLKVCYDLNNLGRPREFKTKEGTKLFLTVYKRAKK